MRIYTHRCAERLQTAVSRLNFGSHCVICSRPGQCGVDLCDGCESLLDRCLHTQSTRPWTELCLSCGVEIRSRDAGGDSYHEQTVLPVGAERSHAAGWPMTLVCKPCSHLHHPFSRIIVPYRYQFPLEHMIKELKYRNRRQLGRVLGVLLARTVRQFADSIETVGLPDFLIPVPMHPGREAERGFNQAADIARWCARELQIDSLPSAVARHSDTGSMAGLSRAERQYRVLGAFRAQDCVAGRRVAIVDDVLTTGSTARELARELYDTGVDSVELWVLARTSRER